MGEVFNFFFSLQDAKIIQMNYVSNWYCLDLLSCLPYDIIYFILDGLKPQSSQNDSNASATSLFSALKGKGAELAFCRDIPSHEKNPDPGDKNPRDIPKVKIPNPGGFQ